MKQKKIPLSLQIFLALGLGIAVGMAFTGNPTFAVSYIKPFGTIFLNLLKFVVVPIVFFSILSGIISMSDIRKVGSIGVKTLVYYTCTVFTIGLMLAFSERINIVLAMFLANLFKGFFTVIDPTGVTFEPGETASFMDTLVDIFPSNIIAPFANASMLQVIVAALLFGFFRALGNVYSGFDLLSNLNLPSSVYNMLPYVISLVVLAFTSQKSRAPKAEGIPYDKARR